MVVAGGRLLPRGAGSALGDAGGGGEVAAAQEQQQLDEDHDGDGEGEEAQLVSPLSTYPLVFIHILLNNTCHCQMWSSCLL